METVSFSFGSACCCIAFGLIDRGTNIIQIRPSSTCQLSCIFCSTNAGPKSKVRRRDRSLTLVNAGEIPVGAKLKAIIMANKHNLFIAEPI